MSSYQDQPTRYDSSADQFSQSTTDHPDGINGHWSMPIDHINYLIVVISNVIDLIVEQWLSIWLTITTQKSEKNKIHSDQIITSWEWSLISIRIDHSLNWSAGFDHWLIEIQINMMGNQIDMSNHRDPIQSQITNCCFNGVIHTESLSYNVSVSLSSTHSLSLVPLMLSLLSIYPTNYLSISATGARIWRRWRSPSMPGHLES